MAKEGLRSGGWVSRRLAAAAVLGLILLLCFAAWANAAAINLRGASSGDNGAGATTLTLPVPSGVRDGDLLLAQVTVATGGAATTITAPAGWSQVLSTTSGSGAVQVIQRVYRKRASAEPASYDWTFSAARVASGGMTALLGANSNNPIAGSSGASGVCAASPCVATSGSVSTGGATNWVSAHYGIGSAASWTAPPGLLGLYTAAAAGGTSSHGAATVAGAGSLGGLAATADGAGRWVAQLVAVRLDATLPSAALTNPAANLEGAVTLSGTSSDAGSGVASVSFEISPAGANTWTQLASLTAAPYTLPFDTATVADGVYDFRLTSMDWAGNVGVSAVRPNRRIDNTAPSTSFTDPGAMLTGSVPLAATATDAGSGVASVRFEYAPAGTGVWTVIRNDTSSPYTGTFATAGVPDGGYDLRAVATDRAGNAQVVLYGGRIVDNALPSVTLTDPGANLAGVVTLSATAVDAASGIASVSFQVKRSSASSWTALGTDTTAPYEAALVTTASADGLYDLRAIATDNVGKTATSTVSGRRFDNTPPSVSLNDPGPFLRGLVDLTGGAADAGSGVAAVTFEAAAAGSSSFVVLGADPTSPYGVLLDTSTLPDGSYDLHAVATDAAGNGAVSETVAAVVVDNTAPATSDDAPSGWSNAPVTVTLSAFDAGSGAAATEFSLDGSAFQPGTQAVVAAPADGSNDGVHTIVYRSTDRAGNVEADRTATVRIDATSPTVALTDPGAFLSGSMTLAASASDASSGVASVAFELSPAGGDAWQPVGSDAVAPYDAPFDTTGVADGLYDLRTVATDAAGNQTVSAIVAGVAVDNAAPVTTDDAPAGWSNVPVTVTLTASDAGSGVASTELSLDGGPFQAATQVVVPAPPDGSNDGAHTITYRSTDRAGNVEADRTATVRIDATAPTVSLDDPGAQLRGVVSLTASASDGGSGVAAVAFERSQPGGWQQIASDPTAPFAAGLDTAALADGSYDLRAVATDAAGNQAVSAISGRTVDNTAPQTSDDAPSEWSSDPVTVVLTASDAGSGIASTELAVDGGSFQAGSQVTVGAPADGSNDGVHTITYRSTDRAGNVEADRTATVRIDATSPTVALEDSTGLLGSGGPLIASASDAASGVASVTFESSAAGSGDWETLAIDREAPWAADLGALAPGRYDLRAVAADLAGNRTVSPAITIEVGEPAPEADALGLRVLRVKVVERRGKWYLAVRIRLSQPAALRAVLKDPGGRKVKTWRLKGKAGTRTALLALPARRPHGPRCTLVVRASGAEAAVTETRIPLRLP